MMSIENLDVNELLVAKKIVRKGLLKAAESLSFFMKEQVGINELDFQINNQIQCPVKTGSNIHLLTTEIVGELPGVCYLVFSEDEANKLRDIALSVEIKNNPALIAEMNDAIMLEVDNIISASVITEFSNIFKHKIYGNVPSLKLVDGDELQDLVNGKHDKDVFVINFKTQFMASNTNFCPDFVWLFDHKFLNSIKGVARNAESLNHLN